MAATLTGPQVFISFRGMDVRQNFISFLYPALREANINAFIDEDELLGEELDRLLERIEESQIALAVFSKDYTTSPYCMDELAKMKERKDQNNLRVIPIFYRLDPGVVTGLTGDFGKNFGDLQLKYIDEPQRTQGWVEALQTIPLTIGMPLAQHSDKTDREFINAMVVKIQRLLDYMAMVPANQQENRQEGPVVLPNPMVIARQLQITHSDDLEKWNWSTIYEPPNYTAIEIAKMTKIHWLKIAGTFETGNLTPGRNYEAVFVVKLEDGACGWEKPVTLKLKVEQQDGSETRRDRTSNLTNYIGQNWVDILAGVFVAPPRNAPAKITFTMYQYETNYRKNGLVVKGVAIRPSN